MMHTYAWLTWLIAVLVSLSATRNPLYLVLILLSVYIVFLNLNRDSNQPHVPISPLRFTLIVTILTTLFNMLTSHFGETILFTIPGNIPLLSGVLTLEALVYGATNGLVLSGFFLGFLVINHALPISSLLRLVPRAFYPLAVVISIAVTYIPVTQRQFTQIREAQAVRGYRLTGLRGWLPLLMPLLVGGLERALTLSEAMTARGFASISQESIGNRERAFMLSGTMLLPAGFIISLVNDKLDMLALIIGLIGAGLLIYGLWSSGKFTVHTVYRQETWKRNDWRVVIGALLVLSAYLIPGDVAARLYYSPYPKLYLPPFDTLIGIMTLGLLVPLLIENHHLQYYQHKNLL